MPIHPYPEKSTPVTTERPTSVETADELVAVLYRDLRRLARYSRGRLSAGQTMQTTALVHEAYLKLRSAPAFADRQHFLRSAAVAMRHILINLARDARADKRGAGAPHVNLDDAPALAIDDAARLLEIDDALQRLGAASERLAQVVECRFFAGYSEEETALALGLSERTVRRDWIKARAWLRDILDGGSTRRLPPEPGPDHDGLRRVAGAPATPAGRRPRSSSPTRTARARRS